MNLLYEYAVVRVIPRVELEEFINVGVILFCKKSGFLDCRIFFDEKKILCLDPEADIEMISENIDAFNHIASGSKCNSTIAKLPAPERFRWLTAVRSTIIQCSKVHPGFTHDEKAQLERLFSQFVKRH